MSTEAGAAKIALVSYSYVARCPVCNKIIAAMVDNSEARSDHAKDLAKEVASWVRKGFRLERITSEEVRSGEWGFDCREEGHLKKGGAK